VILEIGHFIKEAGQVLEQRPVAMVLEPVNETSSRPSQQEHRSPESEGRLQFPTVETFLGRKSAFLQWRSAAFAERPANPLDASETPSA